MRKALAVVALAGSLALTPVTAWAAMNQARYEMTMACIARWEAMREIDGRLANGMAQPNDFSRLHEKFAGLADNLARLRTRAADPKYGFDTRAGEAAYRAARRPFDNSASLPLSKQLEMWKANSNVSDDCISAIGDFSDYLGG